MRRLFEILFNTAAPRDKTYSPRFCIFAKKRKNVSFFV